MYVVFYIIHTFFYIYTLLLVATILFSWFPDVEKYTFVRWIKTLTVPYLHLFRRWIPPLGILDLSPIVAFFCLRIFEWILLRMFIR